MNHTHTIPKHCPVTATLELIGGKYKPIILWCLSSGTKRFSELTRAIPHATNKMLIQQLRQLEKDKLIKRKVFPVIPPKVEYSLSTFGSSIGNIMKEMYFWGKNYLKSQKIKVDCDMYKK